MVVTKILTTKIEKTKRRPIIAPAIAVWLFKKRPKMVIYMCRSIRNIFQSQKVIHRTQSMIKNLLLLSRNQFTMTAFPNFSIRSNCRMNDTSCKKEPKKALPEEFLKRLKVKNRPSSLT